MPAAVPTVLLLSLGLAVSASTSAPPPAVPAAPAAATVTSADGRARFSILAEGLVRCEYAADGAAFDDRATLAVVNRQPATVPPFTHAVQGKQLIVTTTKLRIAYTSSAGDKPPPPPADMCADAMAGHDAYCSEPHGQPAPRTCGKYRSPSAPQGLDGKTQAQCCAACSAASDCNVWVHSSASPATPAPCYLLTKALGGLHAPNRTVGGNFGSGGGSRASFPPGSLLIEGFPAASLRIAHSMATFYNEMQR